MCSFKKLLWCPKNSYKWTPQMLYLMSKTLSLHSPFPVVISNKHTGQVSLSEKTVKVYPRTCVSLCQGLWALLIIKSNTVLIMKGILIIDIWIIDTHNMLMRQEQFVRRKMPMPMPNIMHPWDIYLFFNIKHVQWFPHWLELYKTIWQIHWYIIR